MKIIRFNYAIAAEYDTVIPKFIVKSIEIVHVGF